MIWIGNEEFRYEVLSVTRNKTLNGMQGGQKIKVQRIRKTDPIYKINVFKDTSTMPVDFTISATNVPGLGNHTHTIRVNEHAASGYSQLTSVSSGHNHQVVWDAGNNRLITLETLGHTHDILI